VDSWDIIVNGYNWVILFFFSGVIRQIIKSLTKEKKKKIIGYKSYQNFVKFRYGFIKIGPKNGCH